MNTYNRAALNAFPHRLPVKWQLVSQNLFLTWQIFGPLWTLFIWWSSRSAKVFSGFCLHRWSQISSWAEGMFPFRMQESSGCWSRSMPQQKQSLLAEEGESQSTDQTWPFDSREAAPWWSGTHSLTSLPCSASLTQKAFPGCLHISTLSEPWHVAMDAAAWIAHILFANLGGPVWVTHSPWLAHHVSALKWPVLLRSQVSN